MNTRELTKLLLDWFHETAEILIASRPDMLPRVQHVSDQVSDSLDRSAEAFAKLQAAADGPLPEMSDSSLLDGLEGWMGLVLSDPSRLTDEEIELATVLLRHISASYTQPRISALDVLERIQPSQN